ncbi:MAG: PmoA family protein [Planctomycetota bacterium]
MTRWTSFVLGCWSVLTVLNSLAVVGRAAEFTLTKDAEGVTVQVDGQLFTRYLVKSGAKPILWPVLGPTGKEMTRAYPMKEGNPDEKTDHVHQRSFWFTHGSVNGVSFWDEMKNHGDINHLEFVKVEGGAKPVLITRNQWVGPDGTKVCQDERTLRFGADAAARWIDFDVTVKATDGPLTFGDTKEGAFGVRVAGTMNVDKKLGGKIINSEGQTDDAAWGKPAAWVDYVGPVQGETLGIAILNHSGSFRFPSHWHVRTYGLFAANPFGLRDFYGKDSGKTGELKLAAGDSFTLRYRVLLHRGDETPEKIAKRWTEYTQQP